MIAPLFLFLAVVSIAILVIVASLSKRESGPLKSRHGILLIFVGLALAFTGITVSTLFSALTLIIGGLAVAAAGFAFAVWKLVQRR